MYRAERFCLSMPIRTVGDYSFASTRKEGITFGQFISQSPRMLLSKNVLECSSLREDPVSAFLSRSHVLNVQDQQLELLLQILIHSF